LPVRNVRARTSELEHSGDVDGLDGIVAVGECQADAVGVTAWSVSCTAPGSCTAVGDFETSIASDLLHPMVATETSGTWAQAAEVKAPTNAGTSTEDLAQLGSISCPTSGSCVAVGPYEDNSEQDKAMAATVHQLARPINVAGLNGGYSSASMLPRVLTLEPVARKSDGVARGCRRGRPL
jgi:hypothetical protein